MRAFSTSVLIRGLDDIKFSVIGLPLSISRDNSSKLCQSNKRQKRQNPKKNSNGPDVSRAVSPQHVYVLHPPWRHSPAPRVARKKKATRKGARRCDWEQKLEKEGRVPLFRTCRAHFTYDDENGQADDTNTEEKNNLASRPTIFQGRG